MVSPRRCLSIAIRPRAQSAHTFISIDAHVVSDPTSFGFTVPSPAIEAGKEIEAEIVQARAATPVHACQRLAASRNPHTHKKPGTISASQDSQNGTGQLPS